MQHSLSHSLPLATFNVISDNKVLIANRLVSHFLPRRLYLSTMLEALSLPLICVISEQLE